MDESKKTWLQWFLDLANLDIGKLTVGERKKWGLEIAYSLTGYFYKGIDGTARYDLKDLDLWGAEALNFADITSPGSLELLQAPLKSFLRKMVLNIERAKSFQRDEWKTLDDIEKSCVLGTIDFDTAVKVEAPVGLEDKSVGETILTSQSLYRWEPEALENATIVITARGKSYAESLLFHFIRSLEGIPLTSLRSCPECGNWFLHISKRKREFCSNKCASRRISREKRQRLKEENPKMYEKKLKRNAKRAHKGYKERIQKKSAPSKVFVARRPIKYKAK